MPLEEVGTVPGSYRIVDLFCLREVLNQIMKCSCRSGQGFSLYQNMSTSPLSSFHCVLDIVCISCRQKVSFGSSTLVSVASNTGTGITRPDIDCKLARLQQLSVRSLWCLLYQADWAQDTMEDSQHSYTGDHALHQGQEESVLDLACGLRSDTGLGSSTVDLSCSLPSTAAELDCSVHLDCSITDSPLDLVDCTVTNTSSPLICAPGSDQSSNMSFTTSKELLSTCDREFYTQRELKLHAKKNSKNSRVLNSFKTCQFCNKQFKKLFNLKQHIRTHTNERPLKCDHCDKRFNDRSSMNKHIRTVHADFRPHTCKTCGKSFSSTSHVTEHQATHTNSKKFACSLCDKRFAFRSSLNKHMVSHSTESKTSDGRRLLLLKDCELDVL
eukprot:GFUD01071558.1.p1 GENE.GFUD01071558.1~~GFUD01071558.1.p1  ORF type:complete len:402 (-),score=110.28 GFUD01071558.1:258-1409(-)